MKGISVFMIFYLPLLLYSFQIHNQGLLSLQVNTTNQALLTPEEEALLVPIVTKLPANQVFYEKGREYQYILGNLAHNEGDDNWEFDQKPWMLKVNKDTTYENIGKELYIGGMMCYGPNNFVVALNGGYCSPLAWAYLTWKASEHKSKTFFVALHEMNEEQLLLMCEYSKKLKGDGPPTALYEKKMGVLAAKEPRYIFRLEDKKAIDFTELFTTFGNAIYEFSLPLAHHAVIIIKSAKHIRFFEANAGVASCSTLEKFHSVFNQYFHHGTIFAKYSKEEKIAIDKEGEVIKKTQSIRFDLMAVYAKKPKL